MNTDYQGFVLCYSKEESKFKVIGKKEPEALRNRSFVLDEKFLDVINEIVINDPVSISNFEKEIKKRARIRFNESRAQNQALLVCLEMTNDNKFPIMKLWEDEESSFNTMKLDHFILYTGKYEKTVNNYGIWYYDVDEFRFEDEPKLKEIFKKWIIHRSLSDLYLPEYGEHATVEQVIKYHLKEREKDK